MNKIVTSLSGLTCFLLLLAVPLIAEAQWTDNGTNSTTQDKIGINVTDPGSYWLRVNGNTFFNGNLQFPTVSHDGLTSQTVLSFPASSDGAYFISRQLNPDKHEFILKMRDNTSGDAFKIWFDDYRGSSYDRTPLIVYGNKIALASDGGKVGIGTTSPTSKLTVDGTINAEEVVVEENVGADFVFEDNYSLPKLSAIERFVQENRHLPEIPSAKEMKEHGLSLGAFQIKLLQKIEELTLYVIDLNKRESENKRIIKNQQIQIREMQDQINDLIKNFLEK